MKISDILRHKRQHGATGDGRADAVVTIGAAQSVTELVGALAEHNIGAIVVVDAEDANVVRGIVSERDVVRRLARDGAGVLEQKVSAIMTTSVLSCTSRDSVDSIAETMTAERIRHVPVIDDDQLVGIVSIGDVVSSRMRQLEKDRGQLEQYIAG